MSGNMLCFGHLGQLNSVLPELCHVQQDAFWGLHAVKQTSPGTLEMILGGVIPAGRDLDTMIVRYTSSRQKLLPRVIQSTFETSTVHSTY